ncbi:hypothetical protein D3C87_1362090 [compost metagenome]
MATTTLLMTSDTSSRKPRDTMSEKESSLLVISFFQPFLGTAFTFQIRLMLSWISIKMAVAPITRVTIPMISPMVLFPVVLAFVTKVCSCAAASAPTRSRISENSSSLGLSSELPGSALPRNKLAAESTMMIRGVREKMV